VHVWCVVLNSQKLLGARKDGATLPLVNKTMMYLSRLQSSGSSPSFVVQTQSVAYVASLLVALLLFFPL